ncbi:hypothetical protein D9758_009976 [Tetrapyrgos nigripes]|uniref:Uncharacterized protein n=1 Tax=Tetrapyrgos nigripes TaxID=182062 RepID=A0A8H5FRK9_9AGAR|nr:hypothetical protein D9758_009976 [Tetrapyrgos nigripes]
MSSTVFPSSNSDSLETNPSQSYLTGSASGTTSIPNKPTEEDDAHGDFHSDNDGNNDVVDAEDGTSVSQKKKKKKKPKKSANAKAKESADKAAKAKQADCPETRPSVLCISRNKHWRYISSYHGPWLQLPVELLESLLALNLDPATLSSEPPPTQATLSLTAGPNMTNLNGSGPNVRLRDQGLRNLNIPDSSGLFTNPNAYPTFDSHTLTLPPPPPNSIPTPKAGKAPPPPIDPGVFRSVTSIRRLIDEAAELSVRASSGLSAAELGSMRGSSTGGSSYGGYGGSAWAAAQTLGFNPNTLSPGGRNAGGGRNVAMSAMRIHRLRALAIQKLAEAYKQDEIASSVMVMQGGSVFDDIAERVLKVDPNDANAKYVHFFHEKIPSRQLAESTTTEILDDLILAHPHRLEYFRTRGVVHCFRDEYQFAIKDFTHALKEARAQRKARSSHSSHSHQSHRRGENGRGGPNGYGNDRAGTTKHSKASKRKGKAGGKGGKGGKANGQAPSNGTSSSFDPGDIGEGPDVEDNEDGEYDRDTEIPQPHPSVLPDAADPIEPQLLFLRGSAFLQQAIWLIEQAVLALEEVDIAQPRSSNNGTPVAPLADPGEIRLCYLPDGKYGGVEVGNPHGPLGSNDGPKVKAYQAVLGEKKFKEQIFGLIKKSIRDHEKFLGHFDSLEARAPYPVPQGAFITEVEETATAGKGKAVEEEDHELEEERKRKRQERAELKKKVEYAFYLSESIRPNVSPSTTPMPSPGGPTSTSSNSNSNSSSQVAIPNSYMFEDPLLPPTVFTTYHPLLVESNFTILLCMMLLGDFEKTVEAFIRTAALVDGLEGYPVFLPPRSMAQAEFIEVLERLASGWNRGAEIEELVTQEQAADAERVISTRSSSPTSSASGEASTFASAFGSSAANSGCSTPLTSSIDLSEPFASSISSASSSSALPSGSGSGSQSTPTCASPAPTCSTFTPQSKSNQKAKLVREDAPEALDALRLLLAPVIARQHFRAKQTAAEKAAEKAERVANRGKDKDGDKDGGTEKKKPVPINIPLHGPRVEVILAWLGGVHLPELEF